jgi:ribosome-binding factor A
VANHRIQRINEEMTKVLGTIIGDVKDSGLSGCVLTVTGVSCAPDLSTAQVFYSYMGSKEKKEVARGLKNAHGFIRTRLAQTLNLRQTPALTFVYDTSIENGAHIDKLLKGLTYSNLTDDDTEEEN